MIAFVVSSCMFWGSAVVVGSASECGSKEHEWGSLNLSEVLVGGSERQIENKKAHRQLVGRAKLRATQLENRCRYSVCY